MENAATTLWFLLDLGRDARLAPDPVEFTGYGWFPRAEVAAWPIEQTDPQMARALAKLNTRIDRQGRPMTADDDLRPEERPGSAVGVVASGLVLGAG
ncbi:hypothetical protein ACPPVO_43740 [Dactylosporangium sp. McL0621]|uniref:hypothetical protein n=1 Tax=Dactylosporangium sp. McL0621 TaxID=3415678 RepID=UPI003CF27A09